MNIWEANTLVAMENSNNLPELVASKGVSPKIIQGAQEYMEWAVESLEESEKESPADGGMTLKLALFLADEGEGDVRFYSTRHEWASVEYTKEELCDIRAVVAFGINWMRFFTSYLGVE